MNEIIKDLIVLVCFAFWVVFYFIFIDFTINSIKPIFNILFVLSLTIFTIWTCLRISNYINNGVNKEI